MDTAVLSKSELTFAAIVDAALDMAAAEGIGRLSLGEIAKRMDISKSGVFSRVGSLEALQMAVLDEFDRRFVEAVFQPAMTQPRGLPRLHALMENWIKRIGNARELNSCLYIAGSFEFDDVSGSLRDRLEQGVLRWRDTLRRTVLQAQEAGQLRPDTDAEQLVFEIYSLIVGLMHDVRFLHDPQTADRMRNAYARLISTYRSFHYHAG
ncbi:MAG: TetR/AcrR family transcriptional regulator [Proteobacteria bacterium]|nr:TetR/AcrR family transcriptional regulator [Pseudomonadota bacterium]